MSEFRPLRETLDRLVGGEPVRLPDDIEPALLGEALVGYADTAPVEVAVQLEAFTSAVVRNESPDLADGLSLLAGTPAPLSDEVPDHDVPDLGFGFGSGSELDVDAATAADLDDPAELADPTTSDSGTYGDDVEDLAVTTETDWATLADHLPPLEDDLGEPDPADPADG